MEDCKVSPSCGSINNNNKKKPRKKRIVKNAYVDVDSVKAQPGIDYCDWIRITRQKLKERERKLFQITIDKIESIVNKEIQKQPQVHHGAIFVFPSQISEQTLAQLFEKINDWQGVQTSRLKSPMTCYRNYFDVAKNWYIQTKKKIYGDLFWVRVFDTIHNSVAAGDKRIELNVICALFDEKVIYSNTKPVALINGGTVICSNAVHEYLCGLHHSLQVKQWIKEQEMCGNWRKKAEAICMQVQSQLQCIIESNAYAYVDLNSSNKTISIKSEPMQIQILGLPMPRFPTPFYHMQLQPNNNSNNNANNPMSSVEYETMPLPPPIMQYNQNINQNTNRIPYDAIHVSPYRVSNSRSSPMVPMNSIYHRSGNVNTRVNKL